tara:strand:- start:390 stop:995 length:606 start_codon:yes stop_codon:yes gene_type:complete
MFNAQKPSENDLPSSSQLLQSTIIALTIAVALLLCIIIPAEYGKDPTGVGKLLGLKEMGEIKMRLEKESLNEKQVHNEHISLKAEIIESSKIIEENQDVLEFIIEPNEAIEIKLEMVEGSFAKYEWETQNGGLNYNLHGDGYKGSQKSITYKKGRMTSSDIGEIISEFDGYHGWFWRNRNNSAVTVTLKTMGDYIQIKKLR